LKIWKPHPVHAHYSASSDGEVRNKLNKIVKLKPDIKSYRSSVVIWNNQKRLYMSAGKFIFECFYGLVPDNLIVMHHDELLSDPYINAPFNLFLGTRSLNLKDAYSKQRVTPTRGEASGNSYLSKEDVAKIRHLRSMNYTYKEIQQEFPIPKSTLSFIINRKTWN
jgi:hypothetical protein